MKVKKCLTVFLSLAVLLSALYTIAPAAYADDSAKVTWNDGESHGNETISGTVTVTGTVSLTAPITISGSVTITGGGTLKRTAKTGSLIKVPAGAYLTLENITLDGDGVIVSDGAGAAIYVENGEVCMKDGTALVNHKKDINTGYGAAICMYGGKFTMDGGRISGCESKHYDGAVYLSSENSSQSEFIMTDGIIENNKTILSSASYGGGAFYVRSASLTVNGGTIRNNSSDRGGAIYNTSYGTTIINGGTIKDNTTEGTKCKGKAIFHSCESGSSATLKIGGNANIDSGNDVYITSSGSVDKYIELTSSVKNPITLTVEHVEEGRVIAEASEGVTLTNNDMAKLSVSNSDYFLKLEDNKIKLTQTSNGETKKYLVYFGYDANGGENAPDGESKEIEVGQKAEFTVTNAVPARIGYEFLGWASDKDSSEAEYTANETVSVSENTTLYAVWKKITVPQETNEFTKELEISGWTYGDKPNTPTAEAKSGTPTYKYSSEKDGKYTEEVPENAGTYYVKAFVAETSEYTGLESEAKEFKIAKKTLTSENMSEISDQIYTGEEIKPEVEIKDGDKILASDIDYAVDYTGNTNVTSEAKAKVTIISKNYDGNFEKSFKILPKTINRLIPLTAPVKNAVPQTSIETEEYTATVVWTPKVTAKFAYRTVYTAEIEITVKPNYTTAGIAENGYELNGAAAVTNDADSATLKVEYSATGRKSSSSSGSTSILPSYTVSFGTDGGSQIASQNVAPNSAAKEPEAPTKEGFEFAGWYTDEELTQKYDFSKGVSSNLKLYAAWKETGNSSNQMILTVDKKEALVFGETKTNDVAPKIVNDRTMLPARFVAENLGASVSWDAENRIVTISGKNIKTDEDITIVITIGAETAEVNGKTVSINSPAFIENDRTYTPIRFISEKLGASVEWIEAEEKVVISK